MRYIYALIDPRDGKPFYIGQTGDPAQRLGFYMAMDRGFPVDARINEIIDAGLEPEILEYAAVRDEAALVAEATLIKGFRQMGLPLTNCGHGGCVRPMSAATRRKMSEARRGNQYAVGHVVTEEHKAKISAGVRRYWADRHYREHYLGAPV